MVTKFMSFVIVKQLNHFMMDNPFDEILSKLDSISNTLERFRNDPTAHVAASRPWNGEISWLVDVYLKIQAYHLCHIKKEIREEGTGRPATHDRDTSAICQL